MLYILQNLLSTYFIPASIEIQPESLLQLAMAVLLIEIMQTDAKSIAEHATILGILKERFSLSNTEVMQLTERGREIAKDTNDVHQFTTVINRELELPEKVHLIEYMWQVAYVDGQVSEREDQLMHKIVDLLHIPPEDNIAARTRARFPDLR